MTQRMNRDILDRMISSYARSRDAATSDEARSHYSRRIAWLVEVAAEQGIDTEGIDRADNAR